ncbi:TetR family transcriptional regulator [Collinsella sp. An2]|uniref:TetR family transcriptional regulator n=1 Tax=Collinsella sp. An2 TaxID=1965585 RepID=UPI001302BC0F|nr:TetR family transcriptional regulator [Collinsella sp. An2]
MSKSTKEAIARAFVELVGERGIDKLSVTDVISRCGMARQTFYYYFHDLDELTGWCIEQTFSDVVAQGERNCDPLATVELFVDRVAENRVLLNHLVLSPRRADVEHITARCLRTCFEQLVRVENPRPDLVGPALDTALSLYAYGITGLLFERCLQPDLDRAALAHQIVDIVYGAPGGRCI